MSDYIKTALIGFGKAGEFLHAPFIDTLSVFELTAILERTPKKAAVVYPKAKVVTDFEAIIKDKEIELLVLATPNSTHAALAEQALLQGKHVIIDKPFAVRVTEAKRLQELSIQTGKQIFVYQNRRWDGDFLTVQKILKEGVLGDIISIESRFDRYRPEPRTTYWKESDTPGNGLWYDLGPHLMDQAFCLFGEPLGYAADIKKQRAGAIGIDYFDVLFQYEKMTYRIHAGMLEKEATPRWVIKGSKGTYEKYGVDPQEARLNAGEKPVGDDWGSENVDEYGMIMYTDGSSVQYPTMNGDYRNFYTSVYEAIRNKAPFPITLNSAVKLVDWLEKLALE
jgi:scyllo-inositol 2-dehydrogenase (NADP+)